MRLTPPLSAKSELGRSSLWEQTYRDMFTRHGYEARPQLTLESEIGGRGRPPHAFHVHQSSAADQIPLS